MKIVCCQCGTEYDAKRKTRKYCSDICKGRGRRIINKKTYSHHCLCCHNVFQSKFKTYQKFCSNQCRDDWYRIHYHPDRYHKLRDENRIRRKERYKANKEAHIGKVKEYYRLNRQKIIELKKTYRTKNKDQYNAQARLRYILNPKTRIEASIRSLISRSIRDKKERPWEELVGYSVKDLMNHLEKQFIAGMSWDNYGDWQIDHIVPRRSFHYESYLDVAFKSCWSLDNLRPLWKMDNIRRNYA